VREYEEILEERMERLSPPGGTVEFSHPTRGPGLRLTEQERDELLGGDPRSASARQVGGDHYSRYAIQPSEFIVHNNLGWLEGNAIKYITRHRHKGKAEDVRKAIHYLELLLEWEYPGHD
jgi:hypothetical protein